MATRCVKDWLAMATRWQEEQGTLASLLDQIQAAPQLITFLQGLKIDLKNISRTGEAIQRYPQAGQLLGRLTTLPCLLLNPGLYSTLLECVLSFYMEAPTIPIERKANAWVMCQMQGLVSSLGKLTPGQAPLHITGHSVGDWDRAVAKEVGHDVCQLLRTSASMDTITAVVRLCLALQHVPLCSDILNAALRILATSPHPEVATLLEMITANQTGPYTGISPAPPLSYQSQLLLWRCYLPALEQEILDLVTWACEGKMIPRPELAKKAHQRHLVRACAEDPAICHAVFHMLHTLLSESQNHWGIVRLLSCLHQAVHLTASTTANVPGIRILYPTSVHRVLHLLNIPPKALSMEACEHHALSILNSLQSIVEADPSLCGLVSTLGLPYQDWYWVSLALTLLGKSGNASKYVDLLWHLSPKSKDQKFHQLYPELVSSLRGLLARSHLSTDDIHCVLGVTDGDGDLLKLLDWSGLTHLFLCFLLLATGGVQVAGCVLDKIYDNTLSRDAEACQLVVVVEAVVSTDVPWLQRISEERVLQILSQLYSAPDTLPADLQRNIALIFSQR